jgi:hypothetical protein
MRLPALTALSALGSVMSTSSCSPADMHVVREVVLSQHAVFAYEIVGKSLSSGLDLFSRLTIVAAARGAKMVGERQWGSPGKPEVSWP